MKKLAFAFIFTLICLLPFSGAFATQFSYSFETASDADVWSGGFFDDSNFFEHGHSLFVNNPFGEVRNDFVTHVLDYGPTVNLEAGRVYTIKGYVMNPLVSHSPSVRTSAFLEPGANTVIVNISGTGDEWAEFSTTFYTGESGNFNLSLHFAEGSVDFGLFVDEISLKETSCTLSSLKISGQSEILIPATGSIKSYYRPFLLTSENKTVDILSSSNLYFSVTESKGVSFNPYEFSLTVTSEVQAGTEISIDCTLRNYANLAPTSLSVTLTDNMIDNSDFDSDDLLWISQTDINRIHSDDNTYISVPTNDYGDFGYFATITYKTPQVLLENVLYVVHARIKSDNAKPFSAIHAKNSAENRDNTIYFSIKDISGEEWIDVFAAFVPQQSGIYDIALNLCSMYDCTIFVDDIKLSSEVLAPEYITLHAPGNIALSNVATTYPVSALLRDQLGNIIPTEDITIELSSKDKSIYFDNATKLLTVNPDTPSGKYFLTATYNPDPSIKAELDFTVSFDYIGDGSFENTIPNEWWMVSSPYECDFYMRHDGHSRRALINCRGSYFMLLNNSYVHLLEGTPYVFNSSFSVPSDCTGTLFIEKLNGEVLPLAQFFISAGSTLDEKRSPELFLAEENAVGRLFIYIEADNKEPFSIYADNLSLKSASILAVNPHITGIPYVNGSVEANFTLFNNIAESPDTSACSISWFVSENQNGIFQELTYGGKNIYFDTTFLNKYVYFEVIPICPVTGFSGTPIRSLPFLVTYDTSGNGQPLPQYTCVVRNSVPYEDYFLDIQTHWGNKYINRLGYSSVVSGKSNGLFYPDDIITRAEFAKMLSTAFSINTVADLTFFDDVSRTDWYYKYVTALYLAGITNGTSVKTFSPDSPLTREEAAVMSVKLFEAATSPRILAEDHVYADNSLISSWALESIKKAAQFEIMLGNPGNIFSPKSNITRGEAAAVICRLATILKKG